MNRRMYPRLMLWPVLLGLVLLVGPAWGQAVVYVDAGASGAGDGSSWADAFTSVQAGLNAAVAGDQVWVAAGRYVENITLVDGVALYGGFAGGEDPDTFDLAERDFSANQTILDGNQAGSVVRAVDLPDESTRIDGFTITNGRADYGGGLYLEGASPTIAHNTIRGNSAELGGGGLCMWCSSATIAKNIITANSNDEYGGGLYIYESAPTISNNVITGNSGWAGGGLCVAQSSGMIANNIVKSNSAGHGGGLIFLSASATAVNNTIVGNSAYSEGGGFYLHDSVATVANTIIGFNSSGIYQSGTSDRLSLRHNCVYGNDTYDYSGLDDLTGSDGNISEDPRLADAAYANWHIQPDSPCVDAGDNEYVSGAVDMDGEARIQPAGGTVDIGADESDGTIWAPGPQVIVRVRPDGDDGSDGSSWALAKRTVQAAIDVASQFGGDVWVAAGT